MIVTSPTHTLHPPLTAALSPPFPLDFLACPHAHRPSESIPSHALHPRAPGPICKPDLCNFVCNIEQCCTILAKCTIYKNSCNMYNMYNINDNIVHKIACNIEQYGEQYYVQF